MVNFFVRCNDCKTRVPSGFVFAWKDVKVCQGCYCRRTTDLIGGQRHERHRYGEYVDRQGLYPRPNVVVF